MSLLPYSERVLQCLPTRSLREGVTREGALPVVYAPLRRIDVEMFATLPDDMLESFLSAMLEQRALVLHNLSVAQQRIVKVVDVRDFNAVWISQLLTKGKALLIKLKGFLQRVQAHYPESTHQAIMAHAPTSFSSLFAVVAPVLNERMRAKVTVLDASQTFGVLAARMDSKALHSMATLASADLPWAAGLTVANGTCEFTTRWLRAREALHWQVRLSGGSSDTVRLFVAWVPYARAPSAADAVTADGEVAGRAVASAAQESAYYRVLHDSTITPSDAGVHSHMADVEGIVWLCVDNTASWWNAYTVSVTFTHDAAAGDSAAPQGVPPSAAEALIAASGAPAAPSVHVT